MSAKTNRDLSVTQFAVIDDENVSATQQVTKGGGGLTLVSQWKSQFDDSEETTDNEWKGENMPSPEHKVALSAAGPPFVSVEVGSGCGPASSASDKKPPTQPQGPPHPQETHLSKISEDSTKHSCVKNVQFQAMPLSWPKPICNGTYKKEEKQKSSQDKEESSLVTAKTTADDDDMYIQPVSGRLEIRVVDRSSHDSSIHTAPTTRETRKSDHKGRGGISPVSTGREETTSLYFDATEESSKDKHNLSPVKEQENRLESRVCEEEPGGGGGLELRRSATAPHVPDSLTPGLRRRRQAADKYVTDSSQLPLRFSRPRRLLSGGQEEPPPPRPPTLPPDNSLPHENNARCRRFHPVSAGDGPTRES